MEGVGIWQLVVFVEHKSNDKNEATVYFMEEIDWNLEMLTGNSVKGSPMIISLENK